MEALLRVIPAIEDRHSIKFELKHLQAGDQCLKEQGSALPSETVEGILSSDACIKGPVGETAMDVIVRLRQMLDLYVNLRPAKSYPSVNCLRPDIDMVIVRENTEDLYRGLEHQMGDVAIALKVISEKASRRIARYALELAKLRRRIVTCVHKANVMRVTDGLFARICREEAAQRPEVIFSEMYVDAAAMNLIRNPQAFDVIVTTNMYGDILSDEAAQATGGLGIAPSANIGDRYALFEPVHGSAPDIAGRGIANPTSLVLAFKMLLDWLASSKADKSAGQASRTLEEAVVGTLSSKVRSLDLGGTARTLEVADAIIERVKRHVEN